MHWFDMAVAGPEIARVLAPKGILAGLWNVLDDTIDWVAGLAQVSGRAVIGPQDTPTAGAPRPPPCIPQRGRPPGSACRSRARSRTADSLVATLATRAAILVMQEKAAVLGRIRAFLASGPETADGEFTLPMLTCVLRV